MDSLIKMSKKEVTMWMVKKNICKLVLWMIVVKFVDDFRYL